MKSALTIRHIVSTGMLCVVASCAQQDAILGPANGVPEGIMPSAVLVPGAGQVAYLYTGNPFTVITGPTYSTSDVVTAILVLDNPLPPNLSLADIRSYSGFQFEISDGHQTLTGVSEAIVSTDASGQIITPWSFIRNCCQFPNNGVSTVVWPGQRGVFDWGILSAPSGTFPNTPFVGGQNFGNPGTWQMVSGSFSCAAVSEIPQSECEALVALYNSTNGDTWTDRTGWLQTITPCSWTHIVCQGGSVTKIFLGNNNLTGSLPTELGDLTNLTNFEPWGNHIGGSIPAELGSLASLRQIWMPSNSFTGSIPIELGNLSQLSVLNLGGSQLTGPVPAELGKASNLTELHLWNNKLNGEIPAALGDLANLMYLNLEGNDLVGSIPSELANLTNLVQFRLLNNQLSGVVPLGVAQVGANAQPDCDFRFNSGLYMPATAEYAILGNPLCMLALIPLANLPAQVAAQISTLVATGSLNAGIGNALTSKFSNALQKLNSGKAKAAQGLLTGIISQIADLIADGEISASDGNNLIALAEALRS